MPPKTKVYPCLGCKVNIKKTEVSVPCEVCEEYTHPDCSKISQDLLKYLIDETDEGSGTTWTCAHCRKVGKVLNNKVKVLSKELQDMRKVITNVQEEQGEIKKDVEIVKNTCDQRKKKCEESKDQIRKEIFSELRERDEKKFNIIVHGLPEAPGTVINGNERKEHDVAEVKKVAKCIDINLDQVGDIKFVKRIGVRDPENENYRPILLGLKDEELKNKMMRARKKLIESDFEDVYIVPDMTKQQRKEEDDMSNEATKRNYELDSETSLNSEWRVVGSRGEKRLVFGRKYPEHQLRGRGGGRGRYPGRGGRRGMAVGRGGHSQEKETLQRKRIRTPEIETSKKKTRQAQTTTTDHSPSRTIEVEEEGEEEMEGLGEEAIQA